MKFFVIIFLVSISNLFLFSNINKVSAQATLTCGALGCNGDTKQCATGFSCTYLSNAQCGSANTVCVPTPATSDARGIIPKTTYQGTEFERRRCTTSDTGNNYLYHASDQTKSWTASEITNLVCIPNASTGTTTGGTTTGGTTTGGTTTGGTTTTTTSTTTNTTKLPNTQSESKTNIIPVISFALILLGISLKLKSNYKK